MKGQEVLGGVVITVEVQEEGIVEKEAGLGETLAEGQEAGMGIDPVSGVDALGRAGLAEGATGKGHPLSFRGNSILEKEQSYLDSLKLAKCLRTDLF
jgi:hypothetical protein